MESYRSLLLNMMECVRNLYTVYIKKLMSATILRVVYRKSH